MLRPLARRSTAIAIVYAHLTIESIALARSRQSDDSRPARARPGRHRGRRAAGRRFWPLAIARELEDAILHLRFNEETVGIWIFRTLGDGHLVETYDRAPAR